MKYIPALDGVRALAVAAVVAHHIFGAGFPGGFIGVDIFFVLSGFLITRLFVIEREKTGTIRLSNFFMRRALRLVPALAVMITVSLVLARLVHGGDRFGHDALEAVFAITYTTNFWLGFFAPPMLGLFDNAWSLAIEEQFYVCWGIGAFALLRFGPRRFAAVVLFVSAMIVLGWRWYLLLAGATPMRIYVGFDTRADELLIGCLGAVLLSLSPAPKMTRYGGLAALVALIATAFCARVYWMSKAAMFVDFAVLITIVSLLSLEVILDVVVNAGSFLSNALSFRPLVYIGSISYGIYLWHWPLLIMAGREGFDDLFWKLVIGAGGSFVMAAVSYRYVERPILALKQRLAPHGILSTKQKLEFLDQSVR